LRPVWRQRTTLTLRPVCVATQGLPVWPHAPYI